jgi:hypothetical protein
MSIGSRIIQVLCFSILNILLSTWLWHMTLIPTSLHRNRGMKEIVLQSFINSALKPLREEIHLASQYMMPSALQSYNPLLSFFDAGALEDDFDVSHLPDFKNMYKREYFNSINGIYIAENNQDIVVLTEHYERPDETGYCVINSSDALGSSGLHEYNLKSYSKVASSASVDNREFSSEDCAIMNSRFEKDAKTKQDTLMVFTTCNHLEITVLAIASLERGRDKYDVLVVDDYSVDGTPDYLIKQVCSGIFSCICSVAVDLLCMP